MEEIDCNHHHHYTNHMTLLSNNQKTLTAGSIIRIVIDELEDYDNDTTITTTTTNNNYDLHYREYEKLMMKELKKWIESSRVSQLDSRTQDLILNLRAAAARARWRRAMHVSLVLSGSSNSLRRRLLLFQQQQQQQQWDEEEEKMNKDGDDATIDYGTIDPNKEQMIHYLRRQVARYRWKKVIAKVLLCVKLNGGKAPEFGIFNSSSDEVVQGNQYVNMNKLLRQALENDPKYFIEGSVMSNLIESSLEVVWFSDFTQNDVVYGICVQREEKKITVVFRGTVNSHNWLMNFRYDMMEVPNPVDDYYPGRVDGLSVHSGFALYLLRRRKDTRRSKMDEIFEKIETIGKELAPDGDYKLCITGHSLGGALATLFGFYCGAKLCLTPQKTKEVRIFTFASPRVGGESFLYAFQHLERAGWIRHARFSCTNDIVPLIPFCNFQVDNLKFYKHVGMRVQLHDTGRIGKWRLRKRLDVSYPLRHDWSSKIARGLMNCIFTNPNTPRGYKMYHTLTEYQRRMHLAMTYRKALGATVFFLDEKRQRLKSLDEYYGFQFKMNVDVYHICEHSFTPYTDGVDFRHRLTKVFLVTPLLYMWLRLLSMVTSADIVIPKLSHWIFVEQVPKILGSIPFLLIIQYLLKLTLGLNFNVEMIKIATKTFDIRWGRFRKMFGRLLLVVPLLNLWVKLILRLTNATVPNNVYWLMLQQLLNLWKLVPFLVKPIYMLLQLSFGLSFLMVALCKIVPIRARSNRWRRYESSFGKMLLATPMLVAWAFLFSAAYKNMALDKPTVGVMNPSNPGWGLNIHNMEIVEHLNKRNAFISNVDGTRSVTNTDITTTEAKLTVVHEQLQPIEEYATGIKFAPTLENGNGLYLVGAGVRKKSVIKVYAVAMYSTPKVLRNTNSHASLYDSARTFDTTLSMTSFVLEMVYSASAEKIAGAIAESVKPRYDGAAADIRVLESLIVEGVHAIGGQAIKGTTFRFDCSDNGVSVTVNGVEQGVAAFKGLGSAFVDVFMDGNSVSPTLIESCLKTWSSDENKSVAASLVELEDGEEVAIFTAEEDEAETDSDFAATKVDEPKETTAISSKLHYEHSDEDAVDESKLTTSPPERKHNLLKMVVKFAFPVF
jgi:predicted lipase